MGLKWKKTVGIEYNGKLNSFFKSPRKNMTFEEWELWYKYLRNYPIKFYRQRVIGNYIDSIVNKRLKDKEKV